VEIAGGVVVGGTKGVLQLRIEPAIERHAPRLRRPLLQIAVQTVGLRGRQLAVCERLQVHFGKRWLVAEVGAVHGSSGGGRFVACRDVWRWSGVLIRLTRFGAPYSTADLSGLSDGLPAVRRARRPAPRESEGDR
jgi:hypothetical protein